MISRTIGKALARARDGIARLLVALHIPANLLTLCGMVTNMIAGLAVGFGYLKTGAGVIIFSSVFDIVDGPVARLSNGVTKFGAILDSSLDRYSDAAVLTGIIVYFIGRGEAVAAGFAFSTLVGSLLVSYTRARAENVIESCKVGYWERGERMTYIIIGLFCGRIDVVMYMLGVLTHVTVLHRLLHAHRVAQKGAPLTIHNIALKIIFADFQRKTIAYDVITGTYIFIPFAVIIIKYFLR